MTDIEVKRKELETAKRIRGVKYDCTMDDEVMCVQCPFQGKPLCTQTLPAEWDSFISTREAELAELEKPTNADTGCLTPSDAIAGNRHMGSAQEPHQSDWQKTGEIPTATGKVDIMQDMSRMTNSDPAMYTGLRAPSLDDFAIALIQGGFYQTLEADEETHAMPAECLFNVAAALKVESDRRRGA